MNQIQNTAYLYGRVLSLRANYAHGEKLFHEYDFYCLYLWKQLISYNAYVDAEFSQLCNDLRFYYVKGLNSVVVRNHDWEEYCKRMSEEFGDDD